MEGADDDSDRPCTQYDIDLSFCKVCGQCSLDSLFQWGNGLLYVPCRVTNSIHLSFSSYPSHLSYPSLSSPLFSFSSHSALFHFPQKNETRCYSAVCLSARAHSLMPLSLSLPHAAWTQYPRWDWIQSATTPCCPLQPHPQGVTTKVASPSQPSPLHIVVVVDVAVRRRVLCEGHVGVT